MPTYQTYCYKIKPLTAFGTPLVGDTLFGQLCWSLRHLCGEEFLENLLQEYTQGNPFAVISDAFPHGFLPLPTVPSEVWATPATVSNNKEEPNRKELKKKKWIPVETLHESIHQNDAVTDNDVFHKLFGTTTDTCSKEPPCQSSHKLIHRHIQTHNTINRVTGTTGTDIFAPYTMPLTWYVPGLSLDVYVVLDEDRLSEEVFRKALTQIGISGYGRDASIGLGKFEVVGSAQASPFRNQSESSCCMTLAPTAPQGQGWKPNTSFYQVQTRFGRHGDSAARYGNPFKKPLLMAKTGAYVTLPANQGPWIGQGIGEVSFSDKKTVHQGYAPVVYIPAIIKE